MPQWPLIFLIIAIVAAVFGFTQIASSAAVIARILFFSLMVLYIIWLLSGRWKHRR